MLLEFFIRIFRYFPSYQDKVLDFLGEYEVLATLKK